jgi:hypothetical protein
MQASYVCSILEELFLLGAMDARLICQNRNRMHTTYTANIGKHTTECLEITLRKITMAPTNASDPMNLY